LGGKSEELFSFLNKDKFLKGGCAKHFQGILNWYEGEPDRKLLDAQIATHLPEKVEYLPQKYLERICANIADDKFRATLNEVIFRYVKPQDQHGKTNLDDLIKYRTQQAEEDIAQKKQELHQANAKVVSIEKKLTEDYRKEIEEKIKLKKEELEANATARPKENRIPRRLPKLSRLRQRRSNSSRRVLPILRIILPSLTRNRSRSAKLPKNSGRFDRQSRAKQVP
jgi:flagellar motility protein MotE (MotC chaperone)